VAQCLRQNRIQRLQDLDAREKELDQQHASIKPMKDADEFFDDIWDAANELWAEPI